MLRLIIVVPFLVLLIIFFLLNMTPVPMNFFSANWQSSVGMIVLLAGIISFAIGALTVFTSLVSQWKRARKAEQKIRDLETQLNELRAQYIRSREQDRMGSQFQQQRLPFPLPGLNLRNRIQKNRFISTYYNK